MTGIAAEKAGIAKAGVALVTQLYPPAIAARIGEVAGSAGARWLPRGGVWDASSAAASFAIATNKASSISHFPRLRGRHQWLNAGLAVAVLRHQDALKVPESALLAAMGWADWPARLQRLADGPLVGTREVWLDGGHNPSAARQISSFAGASSTRAGRST